MNSYHKRFRDLFGKDNPDLLRDIIAPQRGIPDVTDPFIKRDSLIAMFAWAIPNDEAIEQIKHYSPRGLIEIGAGRGYWAALLSKAGVDVIAYDIKPPKQKFFDVKRGGARRAAKYRKRTLLLVWPPYDESMAFNAAKAHGGEWLIYVGEGSGGATGDKRFHRYIGREYEKIQEVSIPQWPGIHDVLRIYQRKEGRL